MSASDSFTVLGVRVAAVQIPDVIERMEESIARRNGTRFISVTNIHGVAEAHGDPSFRHILNSSDLCVPDGMPLVWLGRMSGWPLRRRVYGPELMLEFCRMTADKKYRHFFYGGGPGVAEKLAATLQSAYPALQLAGTYSPPFRPLTLEEDARIVAMINQAAPDVVWVGLGCPKQERWMFEHRAQLNVPVLVGVGQAFDIHSGRLPQAPVWMREHGLEWLFRLCVEPRRLWRRYLVNGTQFLLAVILERLEQRRFDVDSGAEELSSPTVQNQITPRKD